MLGVVAVQTGGRDHEPVAHVGVLPDDPHPELDPRGGDGEPQHVLDRVHAPGPTRKTRPASLYVPSRWTSPVLPGPTRRGK